MKKLLITAMALSCFTLNYGQKKVKEQIIGEWCNPYTYKSTGELKGFGFRKGGKCPATNIPSLDLKTWEVDSDYLIVKGFSKEDGGRVEVYKIRERIGYLTSDSLQLIVNRGAPRLVFLYLDAKLIKGLVTPEVKQLQTTNKSTESLS